MAEIKRVIFSYLFISIGVCSVAFANPIKHLIIENKGFTNVVVKHHTLEINFDGRVVWTEIPGYNQSFREVLGQTDSGYQRVVDSGIQNFSGFYKIGSIIAHIHNSAPPLTNHSVVTTCHNTQPIKGPFRNVVIKITPKKTCTIEEYNVDLP